MIHKNAFMLLCYTAGAFLIFVGLRADVYAYDDEYFKNIQQPIDFSHETHVKNNDMSCEYCHFNARRSINSGIPPVRTCVGCHIVIKGETEVQKKEIAKVMEYWEKKKPIPWNKIHDLPDFVRFSHKRHLSAGFDCTNCHGDVSQVKQPIPQPTVPDYGEVPLSMGSCMSCHRDDHPVTKDAQIAQSIRKTRGGEIVGKAPESVGTLNGPIDCLACHK